MELSDEMLKEISYVQISSYRKNVMKSLDGGCVDTYPNCKKFRD